MATKVSLRQKKISQGRYSLYLDFYPPIPLPVPVLNKSTGEMLKETRREFLGMYVYVDKVQIKKEIEKKQKDGKKVDGLQKMYNELKSLNDIQKRHNDNTLTIAESIKEKRQNILNKPEIYSEYEKQQLKIKELGEQCFVEYFKKLANKRKASNHDNWVSVLNYLTTFTHGSLKFADLNQKFIEDFKEYLLTTNSNRSKKTTLSQNSAVSYFNKVKAALKQAYAEDLLQDDLNAKIKPIKPQETEREFLTIEEINKLVKIPFEIPVMKDAALFSALTGLRFSDIKKMTWSELEFIQGHGYFLKYRHKKSKRVEMLPIAEQAYNLTGGELNPNSMPQNEVVFKDLKYSSHHNDKMRDWISKAGITKKITFHNFRHSYATLQLFGGTDIYTVSKMLGHKNLKTTQIYAKIVDETKRKAANKIKLDL